MRYLLTQRAVVCLTLATIVLGTVSLPWAATPSQTTSDTGVLPIEQFSPSFLGIYRKVMEIEDEIRRHADTYDVDIDLAWSVCLYESGGNGSLNSWAGAQGYFQVMPATFRSLHVDTNIEAGPA